MTTSLHRPLTDTAWPDVVHVPAGPRAVAGARVAAAIFRHAVQRLPLQVVLPTGVRIGAGGPAAPALRVHDLPSMMRRLATSGLIGFGESYVAGEWEANDLAAVIAVFARAVDKLVPSPLQHLRRLLLAAHPSADRPTSAQSPGNVHRHYDLSNELFAAFLDETMTYSAALFDHPTDAVWGDLAPAQLRKMDRLLDQAGVGPGTRLLEIGTGWGALAARAADRGAFVESVTLSSEQLDHARRRIADAGLSDRVRVRLADYRELTGSFDAIVSVEMIEAVGLEFLPAYFDTLHRCLAPGGRIALQAITMPHHRAITTQRTYTWIHKYIFPGGAIPSTRMLRNQASAVGLTMVDDLAMGVSYAATLRLWADRFDEHRGDLATLGFDELFARTWQFYLRYCEGGFRAGYLDVHQVTYRREGDS
ncbi:SAM-dependent methyltransferase [Flexivirga oryzae]|uniref:Cyclopropane-fatty-acyl-phospholipid synthase n=1 Tax=Flexivirga oryzae TaxID=1794944 RepID=A0A839NAB4_9MICO|nr:cyclopropane-fatty-acyl-phospholipid synthase family protein [Flexivirga oryzae]MBB2891572.1 cyclopropane-fatty-acyl-phospholipid synthase [Flexivirga oryzae]